MRRAASGLVVALLASLFLVIGSRQLRAQMIDWSSPASRQDLQEFQRFLSAHPWIANKLRENPAFANNRDFLNDNPELPQFLSAHPFVESSFKTDARGTMSRAQQTGSTTWNNPAVYQERQEFQQFLNNHPWIAGKLRQNPSLANDADFLNDNRELPQFLNAHPYIQSSLKTDARGFMLQMQNSSATPAPQASPGSWQDAQNRNEIMEFRNFLNSQPGLATTLQNDPSLVNNQSFLSQHYDLQNFLNSHAYVQHSLQSDATGFMRRMRRFGASYGAHSQGEWPSAGDQEQRQETQAWMRFMSDHPWIAGKLRQKPALATSRDFLNDNPPLAQFLNSHPYVQSQFRADPNGFMDRASAFAAGEMQGRYDPHASDYQALNLFMQNHKWIANQLKEKPSRATSSDFLNENRELRDFLQAHPYLQDQFKQDARGTVNRALQLSGRD